MGGQCMWGGGSFFLSILGGSRSMGGGDVCEECREQGPLTLLPFAFPLFSFFLLFPCRD